MADKVGVVLPGRTMRTRPDSSSLKSGSKDKAPVMKQLKRAIKAYISYCRFSLQCQSHVMSLGCQFPHRIHGIVCCFLCSIVRVSLCNAHGKGEVGPGIVLDACSLASLRVA